MGNGARAAVLVGILMLIMTVPLLGLMEEPKAEPIMREVINDKPYVEPAEKAVEEAETYAEEQEQAVETYAEPVYYTNNYWYESDDAEAEAEAKEWIAQRESGGDYGAQNGRYVGRYQLDASYLDGDWSEESQESAAESYVADRYGSWQAAKEHHESHGWY